MANLVSKAEESAIALANSQRFMPGGVSSINRLMSPSIAFSRGKGALMWDSAGKEYIDFHAGFAPFLLGHNQDEVNNAVIKGIEQEKACLVLGQLIWKVS